MAALELGLPVSHRVQDVVDAAADLGVVVAYGRIISAEVLDRLDMVNVHFSLLPRWRGAAPVERAILAGDTVTGVCLMAIDEGLDTGPVYRCEKVAIGDDETAAALVGRLAVTGAALLVSALDEGLGSPAPQRGEATYAAKITPEDLHLDWSQSAAELVRVVRVGRAWTTWRGKRLLVHQAARWPRAGLRAGGPRSRRRPGPWMAAWCGQATAGCDSRWCSRRAGLSSPWGIGSGGPGRRRVSVSGHDAVTPALAAPAPAIAVVVAASRTGRLIVCALKPPGAAKTHKLWGPPGGGGPGGGRGTSPAVA